MREVAREGVREGETAREDGWGVSEYSSAVSYWSRVDTRETADSSVAKDKIGGRKGDIGTGGGWLGGCNPSCRACLADCVLD